MIDETQIKINKNHRERIEKLESILLPQNHPSEEEIDTGVYDILLILDDTVETKRLCQKNK